MMKFKPLQLEDKKILESYLKPYKFKTSEYSFTNLFIWRKGCQIEYAILKNTLIIKKRDFSGQTYFMQPVGYKKEELREIVETLIDVKETFGLDYLFGDVEEAFAEELQEIFGNAFDLEEDRDNFDYIYESDKLATLSGKKLHKKKNHYNYFTKNYSYEVKELTPEIAEECADMADNWYESNKDGSEHLAYELEAIKELLGNKSEFGYDGLAVYIDGKPAAFAIGERLNKDMAVIHIEKADPNINGLYTFINKALVESSFQDTLYINREQDLGIENLRKAKESYYPIRLETKYKVKQAEFSCCYLHPVLVLPECVN